MVTADVVRSWQFDLLEKSLSSFRCLVNATAEEELAKWRDGGRGWTALEVLCHLRDFEEVFRERAVVTLREVEGRLPFPDPDVMAVDRRYKEQKAQEVFSLWESQRRRLLDLLRPLPQSQWARTALHPKRGLMTLQDQLTLITWHDANHMEQMTRILEQRRA